jgi:hypothetical protein
MFHHSNTKITLHKNESVSQTNAFSYNHMYKHRRKESSIANNQDHNFIWFLILRRIYFYICYIHLHILFYSFRLAGRKVSINKTFCVVILYIKGLLQQRDQSTCNFWSCTFTKFQNVWYFLNIFITFFANVNWCTMMDFSTAYNYLSNEKEPVQWVWS